jgi:hypothetical protein
MSTFDKDNYDLGYIDYEKLMEKLGYSYMMGDETFKMIELIWKEFSKTPKKASSRTSTPTKGDNNNKRIKI